MMNSKSIIAFFCTLIVSATGVSASADGTDPQLIKSSSLELRHALELQSRGMHNRASLMLQNIDRDIRSNDPEGYAILSDVTMNMKAYASRMNDYIQRHPHSLLVYPIKYQHALNLFEQQDYKTSLEVLEDIPATYIPDSQLDEYLFKKAYCELEVGDMDRALLQFESVVKRPISDFTAPSRYSIAYINYDKGYYRQALEWFEIASTDRRFAEICDYYIMECRFLLKDYKYVAIQGEEVYSSVWGNWSRNPEKRQYLSWEDF